MKLNKKSLLKVVVYVSLLCFSLSQAYADIPKISSASNKKISECLRTWDNSGTCKQIKREINEAYKYYAAKGRNRRSSNKWATRKSAYSIRELNRASTSKKSYKKPLRGGLPIDVCVQGKGWKKSDAQRCDSSRLKIIGNDFCQSKGMKKSLKITKHRHAGKHAVLTYNKNRPESAYWKRQRGSFAIKSITCSNL